MGFCVGLPGCFYYLRVLGEGLLSGFHEGSSQRFPLLTGGSSGESQGASSSCPRSGMPWSDEECCYLMPGLGTGVSDVRATEMDPMSAVLCGWVVAGISKRGAKETMLARSCSGYIRAQQSSDGQASSTAENCSMKAWCFHSSAITLKFNVAILSKWACCRAAAASTCCDLALVCHASALASWASFWHTANSSLKPSSLHQQSVDALTMSNSLRPVVTFLCS